MLIELVRSKRDLSQLIKFLHYFVYPFLTGFLLDLSWPNQLVISASFAFVVFLVGNFPDALLLLWQAIRPPRRNPNGRYVRRPQSTPPVVFPRRVAALARCVPGW